ncbi:aldehyde dehydrogenase family protein [Rhodococcus hoagii]|nr:aldehyde dehydrogenase family protein [Prescottella equi]
MSPDHHVHGTVLHDRSRILVQRSIADRVREALVHALVNVHVGPGTPTLAHGSDDRHLLPRPLESLLADHADDAEILVRGGRPDDPPSTTAPTSPALLAVHAREVPTRPTRTVRPGRHVRSLRQEDDAVRMANATEYGLAASV